MHFTKNKETEFSHWNQFSEYCLTLTWPNSVSLYWRVIPTSNPTKLVWTLTAPSWLDCIPVSVQHGICNMLQCAVLFASFWWYDSLTWNFWYAYKENYVEVILMLNAPYGWEVWANNKAKNVIFNDWTANKELYKFTSQGSRIPTISPADCFRSHDDNRQTHKHTKPSLTVQQHASITTTSFIITGFLKFASFTSLRHRSTSATHAKTTGHNN